ncbi:glycosyl transferase, family 2 [Winogradskyella psychrotolerans RS-3]|uniref:Glycosyl transferase, family 2 n=1 Tax=Winogradskyella psychrotolerans RS-3 TaxID=641526 RepID=S7VZ46_9FLAO|nr:glycosyltransferase family A protein [Winogradskyella psychrotolerans]EPR74687.1 glycosyl transferase, family 2 [Winogradskyella psychrotolerans RS-3]
MIVLIHNKNRVVCIYKRNTLETIDFIKEKSIINILYDTAKMFPNETMVWCHLVHEKNINYKAIEDTIVLKNEMCSFSNRQFLPDGIGYVEQSPFIKINKTVKYPTWLMSSEIGAIHASQLIKFKTIVNNSDFDYALNSIAKLGMPKGLFCYSEPKLLINDVEEVNIKASVSILFKFVKEHYKIQWTFFLFLTYLWHEKHFKIVELLRSFFYKRRFFSEVILPTAIINTSQIKMPTIDVIIPSIGRKKYLYDVLEDLRHQTILPERVIIVEQNPLKESDSELDYLTTESWPFIIDHTFTHQTGACNARNIALSKVKSDWVFLNDDDNRFASDLLQKMLDMVGRYGLKAIISSYLLPNQIKTFKDVHQTSIFGSGNSFIKADILDKISFNMKLEFGYGEDTEFGLQLRNLGVDVIYLPGLNITHLKAPMGGFRTKFIHPWDNEKVQPKPSPTIMYVNLKYKTTTQLLGSKTLLFLKMFVAVKFSKKATFYKEFNNRWETSKYWAKQL